MPDSSAQLPVSMISSRRHSAADGFMYPSPETSAPAPEPPLQHTVRLTVYPSSPKAQTYQMEPMHRSTPGGRSSHHARSAPKGFAGTPGDFWMCPPGVCISWAGSRMHRWIRARHDAAAEDVRRDLHIATAEASAMQRISGTASRGDAYSRRSETLVHVCRTQIEKQPRGNPLGCECLVGVRRFELLTSSVSGKRSPPELNARLSLLGWGALQQKNTLRESWLLCKKNFPKSAIALKFAVSSQDRER